MKKSLLVLSVAMLAAGSAAAQSSVTLFGVVDASARGVKNGSAGSQKQLASGGLSTGRLGFRGTEDLGGGFSAAFHLEAGISPDTGTTDAKFFGRRSTVSLVGRLGEIRLGRDYNPTAVNTFNVPFGLVGVGSIGNFTYAPQAALGSGATTVLRNDNSIGYFLPGNMGGIYGSAMVAAGEGVAGNKYRGARFGYGAGPIDVAAGYGKTETAANAADFDQYNVKALYTVGFAKLNFLYDVKKWSPRAQKMAMFGVTVPMGTSELRAAYAVNNRSGGPAGSGFAEADDSKLMSVGYVNNLSARTALYATLGRITNDAAARSSVSNTTPAGMLGGETSTGYEFGLSHRF